MRGLGGCSDPVLWGKKVPRALLRTPSALAAPPAQPRGPQTPTLPPQNRAAAPGSLLASQKGPDTGFVPFHQRARGGAQGPRRLAADALRTLESLYGRSPYPSKAVLQSICDMHRLPRWGVARALRPPLVLRLHLAV